MMARSQNVNHSAVHMRCTHHWNWKKRKHAHTREGLEEALVAAEAYGDRDAIAVVHHSFLGLEQVAGDLAKGLEHGWVAVATYESPERKTQCMAGLASALIDYGDHEAAEDAIAFGVRHTRAPVRDHDPRHAAARIGLHVHFRRVTIACPGTWRSVFERVVDEIGESLTKQLAITVNDNWISGLRL